MRHAKANEKRRPGVSQRPPIAEHAGGSAHTDPMANQRLLGERASQSSTSLAAAPGGRFGTYRPGHSLPSRQGWAAAAMALPSPLCATPCADAFLWWPVGAVLCSVSEALGFDACVLLWRCDFVASWSWLFSFSSFSCFSFIFSSELSKPLLSSFVSSLLSFFAAP